MARGSVTVEPTPAWAKRQSCRFPGIRTGTPRERRTVAAFPRRGSRWPSRWPSAKASWALRMARTGGRGRVRRRGLRVWGPGALGQVDQDDLVAAGSIVGDHHGLSVAGGPDDGRRLRVDGHPLLVSLPKRRTVRRSVDRADLIDRGVDVREAVARLVDPLDDTGTDRERVACAPPPTLPKSPPVVDRWAVASGAAACCGRKRFADSVLTPITTAITAIPDRAPRGIRNPGAGWTTWPRAGHRTPVRWRPRSSPTDRGAARAPRREAPEARADPLRTARRCSNRRGSPQGARRARPPP